MHFNNNDYKEHQERFLKAIHSSLIDLRIFDTTELNNNFEIFINNFFGNLDSNKKFYYVDPNRSIELTDIIEGETKRIRYNTGSQLKYKIHIHEPHYNIQKCLYDLAIEMSFYLRNGVYGDSYILSNVEIICHHMSVSTYELLMLLNYNETPIMYNVSNHYNSFNTGIQGLSLQYYSFGNYTI